MKQFFTYLLLTVLGLAFLTGCQAQKASIRGPQGEIAYKVTLPEGFDTTKDQCPMVILMHGIFSSKDYGPMPQLAKGLAKAGIASIRFDFGGHGKSEGRKQYMTIEKELAEAKAVWDYVQSLPYVKGVGLLGHSQGGVVASMARSSRKLAREVNSSTHASTPRIRRNTSAVGDCISWGASISSPRSSSTSMALQRPIKVQCSSSTVTATASFRCGAASVTWRPMALMPP